MVFLATAGDSVPRRRPRVTHSSTIDCMPLTGARCTRQVSRRPRGTCPVCQNVLSLCWSGEIKVLRKHTVSALHCAGSGLPAVGELPEMRSPTSVPLAVRQPAETHLPVATVV